MVSVSTPGTFARQLADSELLSPAQLAALPEEAASASPEVHLQLARALIKRGWLTRFQAERLLEGRTRGFFFDEYKLTEILGVGGMGSVYQALDAAGRPVALKVLQDQLKNDEGMQARFVQEAQIGIRLNDPHLLKTRSLGSAGGLPYMVMEFVEGPSLLELLLRTGPLPWQQACDIARQAALGLAHLHAAGLVHRDVKPQNLLIDAAGHVKLLDFGLSMVCDGEAGDEFSMAMIFGHQCVGTAEYAPPEQIENSLAADARSDIYSLGATLFTMLTGTTPFEAETTEQMLQAHREGRLRSVSDLVPDIPADVDRVVAALLARNPQDRPATAAAAAAALAPLSEQRPVAFNFEEILAERSRAARQRRARQPRRPSRSTPGLASSTARPTASSSIADDARVLAGESRSGARADGKSPSKVSFSGPVALPSLAETGTSAETTAVPRVLGTLASLDTGAGFPLMSDRIVIGRRGDCHLQIENPAVSSQHCELRFDGYNWWIADLHSRNGTTVNGVAVQQHCLMSGAEHVLAARVRRRIE